MESRNATDIQGWDALAALEWQIELGADEAILDEPQDAYGFPAQRSAPEAKPPGTRRAGAKPQPAAAVDPVADAAARARGARDLAALAAAVGEFTGSELREAAMNCVFADGDPRARVMVIGEAPGREEDRAGKPFVGQAGQLLDKMFAAIGLSRSAPDPESSIYITNILPWRPPQNRTPTKAEIALFLPFVARHIDLARPEFLVCLGNTPCTALLGRGGVTKLRGTWDSAHGLPVMPMFHPAYLLRNPAAKREAWEDLLSLRARMDDPE